MLTWQFSKISAYIITALALLKFTLSNIPNDSDDASCSIENNVQKCTSSEPAQDMYRRMLFPNLQKWFEKVALQHKNNEIQRLSEVFPLDSENENYVRQVRNAVFSKTDPTPMKTAVKLAGTSADALVDILDLDVEVGRSKDFLEFVSGLLTMPGYSPLAHRYGGHQFGYWAGQLGDGRAIMIGEYKNSKGEKWELQLKGSGLTPYSRTADGRAVIRSSVREFLCSEAMYYLGVPTSRAASLVISKDVIMRDQFYNGRAKFERCAVVLRLAQSWFRIGSLEILAYSGEQNLLKQVVDYIIKEYFPKIDPEASDRYLTFLADVVERTAKLMAQWQSVGFSHGVMNTDNFSLLGITIDYGPFGFLDEYNPDFIPNTSDDDGRYSYKKQPDVGFFNMQKLGHVMRAVLSEKQTRQVDGILRGYQVHYDKAFLEVFGGKLGLQGTDSKDEKLINSLLDMMKTTRTDFTMTFRQLGDVTIDELREGKISDDLWALKRVSSHEKFSKWAEKYLKRIENSKITDDARTEIMHKNNPRYVLRNWIAQAVIEDVRKDNFDTLETVQKILKKPFTEQPEAEELGYAAAPPDWAKQIRVSCSS
ncbi:protein adenylyltransferase SelO-like [Lineus longissimus]|uniref:protein adenylyltransferase SelO-like n=1 Tax=Lineus longissimus TaxID=88925 RepID=UPI00315D1402